jgi:photosystem II stability/assembly factor-like uncharacterized protein
MNKMRQSLKFLVILTGIVHAQDGWFWQYPKPQGNSLNDIFVFNANKAIAVGDLGTIIKTADGGENWEVRHHVAGSSLGLSDVLFLNDQTGWMVRNDAVLKTTDGGENWDLFFQNPSCAPDRVYFINADTGFVFGRNIDTGWGYGMIFTTTDGGGSWTSQHIGFDIHGFTSACFTSPDTGWIVGEGDCNAIYKTVTGGEIWIQQSIQPSVCGLREIKIINNKAGFIVGRKGNFLKTADGGESWEYQDLSEKYQNVKYQSFYSVHFTDSLHGWIVGGDYGGFILRTKDGGENWEEENMEIPGHLYKISFSDSLHGWIVGQFGLIYRTSDGGENWILQSKGATKWLTSVSFADEQNGWVVGEDGTILNTEDGGLNWMKQQVSNDLMLFYVKAIDFKNIVAVGAVTEGTRPAPVYLRKAAIVRSTNGGQTWVSQTIDTTVRFMSVCFPSSQKGWAVGSESVIKTTDGGESWHPQINVMKGNWGYVQFINDKMGWILGYRSNFILRTKDEGEKWETLLVKENAILLSIYFVKDNIGWAVGEYNSGNNLFKTVDGGETWHSQDISEVCHLNTVYFTDEQNGWVAGYNYLEKKSCIFHTEDGGEHWFSQESSTTADLFSLFFIGDNTGWAVGEGAILKTTNRGESSVEEKINENSSYPQLVRLEQNYPNPFNPATAISFHLPSQSFVSLKVFNVLGREVSILIEKELPAGSYVQRWDAEGLPSGIYFYRLHAGSFTETKKLILQR